MTIFHGFCVLQESAKDIHPRGASRNACQIEYQRIHIHPIAEVRPRAHDLVARVSGQHSL